MAGRGLRFMRQNWLVAVVSAIAAGVAAGVTYAFPGAPAVDRGFGVATAVAFALVAVIFAFRAGCEEIADTIWDIAERQREPNEGLRRRRGAIYQ